MSNLPSRLIGIINNNMMKKVNLFKPIRSGLYTTNRGSQIRLYNNILCGDIPKLKVQEWRVISLRQKSKRRTGVQDDDSDDEEGEGDNDFEALGPGFEVKTLNLNSLRVDSLLREGLGYKRKAVEGWFYKNELRLNGKIINRKSTSFNVDDEIDVIRGFSKENPNLIYVSRVEVIGIKADVERSKIIVKANCSKHLLIENYPEGDPLRE